MLSLPWLHGSAAQPRQSCPAITCLAATSVRAPPRSLSCRSYPRQRHRVFGLRFTAALATRLGPEGMKPYLGPLMVPLFRITEGGSADSEEVRVGLSS